MPTNWVPIIALVSLVTSCIGSGIGALVVIKVGLAKMETWRDRADEDIRSVIKAVHVLQDDSLVFDGEIDLLYNKQGIHRAVRQRMRG